MVVALIKSLLFIDIAPVRINRPVFYSNRLIYHYLKIESSDFFPQSHSSHTLLSWERGISKMVPPNFEYLRIDVTTDEERVKRSELLIPMMK